MIKLAITGNTSGLVGRRRMAAPRSPSGLGVRGRMAIISGEIMSEVTEMRIRRRAWLLCVEKPVSKLAMEP